MIFASIKIYIYKNGMILIVNQSDPPVYPYTPSYKQQINFPKFMYKEIEIILQNLKESNKNVFLYYFPYTDIKHSPYEYLSKTAKNYTQSK